jgi:hypothetical protein
MAYVGNPIDTTNTFQSLVGKRFSGNASTTAFTLDVAPSSTLDIEVFVENVRQDPNSAYSLSGTTLTFAAAPPSGTNNIYVVHQAKAVGTISPAAGTVNADSFDNTVISGHDALAAEPADTDEFLVSDAGTIKRIDYSLIKAKGKIAQVVTGTTTTSVSVSGNDTYVDTGLTASITPSATSSKVLVLVSQAIFLSSNDGTSEQTSNYKLLRDSTAIFETPNNSDLRVTAEHAPNNELRIGLRQNLNILDSPSSSSSVTYKTQLKKRSGVVSVAQDNSSPSHITLMEVLA